MIDDTKYEIHPEIAAALAVETELQQEEVVAQEQQVAQPEPEATQQHQETPQQLNFRILKERAERAERERDQILKLAQQHLPKQELEQKPVYTKRALGKDDIVEGKDLDPLEQEIREIKAELNQYKQYTSQ